MYWRYLLDRPHEELFSLVSFILLSVKFFGVTSNFQGLPDIFELTPFRSMILIALLVQDAI